MGRRGLKACDTCAGPPSKSTPTYILVTFGESMSLRHNSEEDKRATTNVQNGLVFFFLFSFILFSDL